MASETIKYGKRYGLFILEVATAGKANIYQDMRYQSYN